MTRVDSSSKWLPGLGFGAPTEVVVLLSKDEGGGDTTEDALLLLLLELPKRKKLQLSSKLAPGDTKNPRFQVLRVIITLQSTQ